MDPLSIYALVQGGIGLANTFVNWAYSEKSSNRQDESLDLQRQSLGIQQQSLNESLRSNYYSYLDRMNSINGSISQNLTAINQERENIASNMNYLDRWASEFDQSMQSNLDEAFSQYQQLASNYATGLVSNAETGRRGGSAGRIASDKGVGLKSLIGSTDGFGLTGNRLGAYLSSSAMDMLADKQTAISAVGASYKAIDSYQKAVDTLNSSYSDMKSTTDDIKKKLAGTNAEIKEAK